MNLQFRDVVKKYTDPGEALGRDPDTGDVTGLEPGTDVDPVEVVTDPAAQAALSATFATHQDLDDAAIGEYTPEQLIAVATSPEAVAALAETFALVYTHDGTAYAVSGGRIFIGPEDPDNTMTPAAGDIWMDPS